MIKVSDYIMQFLKSKKVSEIFMLPGGGAMHLVDSLGTSGIHYTCFQHEQGAAIAAEAYGQHTTTPGVLLVTSGPGATNAITGVTAGWIDSTPMFILSGQAKTTDLIGKTGVRQSGSQEVQIIEMISPITKYAVQITDVSQLRYHLERAWQEAVSGRPGPVWLSVPLDIQGSFVDPASLPAYRGGDFSASEKSLRTRIIQAAEKTAALIAQSNKPLLLAGNGILLSRAGSNFRLLAEHTRIPVQTTWKAIELLDEEDICYAGHPGIMGDRGANLIIQECDLLISIGSRLDSSITAFNDAHFAPLAKKVLIDIDRHELERMQLEQVELRLDCDAGLFIEALMKCLVSIQLPSFDSWLSRTRNLRSRFPVIQKQHRTQTEYVSAYYFIEELCRLLTPEDIIVPESSGGAGEITYQAWKLKYGQKIKNAAGLGSMGFGLPYAIGSCIANKGQRTILINGDGAFQLNIQELETLRRLNLPVKIFIWDNQGYASIRTMQANTFDGRFVACNADSGYTTPDIQKIAEAYGFPTYLLENNDAVALHLASILDLPDSCVCIVKVLPDEPVSPRVKSLLKPDGTLVSGTLENMWPYLTNLEDYNNTLN